VNISCLAGGRADLFDLNTEPLFSDWPAGGESAGDEHLWLGGRPTGPRQGHGQLLLPQQQQHRGSGCDQFHPLQVLSRTKKKSLQNKFSVNEDILLNLLYIIQGPVRYGTYPFFGGRVWSGALPVLSPGPSFPKILPYQILYPSLRTCSSSKL
jgi:hypothetical protein